MAHGPPRLERAAYSAPLGGFAGSSEMSLRKPIRRMPVRETASIGSRPTRRPSRMVATIVVVQRPLMRSAKRRAFAVRRSS